MIWGSRGLLSSFCTHNWAEHPAVRLQQSHALSSVPTPPACSPQSWFEGRLWDTCLQDVQPNHTAKHTIACLVLEGTSQTRPSWSCNEDCERVLNSKAAACRSPTWAGCCSASGALLGAGRALTGSGAMGACSTYQISVRGCDVCRKGCSSEAH